MSEPRKPTFPPAAFVGLFLMFAGSAKADYVVMKNGDRITGDIKQIWDGELTIEPDYGDEWNIDIAEISEIVGDEEFEIELADGTELTAQLGGVDDDGQQLVVTDESLLAVPLVELAELEEPEDYFDWDSNIDANTVINKGNTDSETVRIYGTTNLKIGDHRHVADLTIADESLDGVSTKEQRLLTYGYGWLFRDPLFLSVDASHERDPIRGLDSRTIAGAGLGYELWDDADKSLTFSGGLGYQSEDIADEKDENSIAYWSFRLSKDYRGGDLTLFHNHSITTNISGRDNSVGKFSVGAQLDVSDSYYVNLSLNYDYESDPVPGAEKEDLTVLAGVGIEF